MAATRDEAMEELLSSFDQIYEDVENGNVLIQSLQSNYDAEMKKNEALQFSANSLKSDKERLTKLYTGSLCKLADQLEGRAKCQNLKEELERQRDELIRKEHEYRNGMVLLKQDSAAKIKDLESQIRGFLIQKDADQAIIKQLQGDLVVHRNHLESVTSRLKRVRYDEEYRYQHEIQDLKDCLMIEQEEKNELGNKLLNLEKELLISRTKLAENQRDWTTNRHVETLKQKIMRLRKENEDLKRNLHDLKDG